LSVKNFSTRNGLGFIFITQNLFNIVLNWKRVFKRYLEWFEINQKLNLKINFQVYGLQLNVKGVVDEFNNLNFQLIIWNIVWVWIPLNSMRAELKRILNILVIIFNEYIFHFTVIFKDFFFLLIKIKKKIWTQPII
jgi:hypothetical protein